MARLGDICKLIADGDWIESKDQANDGIRLIQIGNIGIGKFLDKSSKSKYISSETFNRLKCTEVFAGDILISRLPDPVGRACMVPANIGKAITAVDCTIIRLNDSCISNYFLNYTQSDRYYNELQTFLAGTTRTRISRKNLEKIEIPLPPLDEQRRIAATLDKVTDLISKRRQQLDKLDELVKARFVEMFGDLADPKCQYTRCKLVDACVDSDDIKCGPFGTQLSKDEYQKGGVAVWEIPQINSGFKECPTHFLTAEKARQLNAYSLIPGDIAMSRKGNVGRCGLYPKTFEPGIIHSDVLRIRVDSNRVDPCFMMYQLHFSRAVERQIEMVSSGAIMAGINVTKLKHIYVHIPPVNLQRQFTSFVDQTENIKTTVSRSLEKLETLKKALMQEYFG